MSRSCDSSKTADYSRQQGYLRQLVLISVFMMSDFMTLIWRTLIWSSDLEDSDLKDSDLEDFMLTLCRNRFDFSPSEDYNFNG